ncbi:hypothetical protein DFH08DRAFT_971716 [Mycena albidolilacea]|uniref:Uncharacterized protein n=1 Tax=Mycena albidolilacea TaxID=1033008 RepID=A0AAD6ZC87_9AGAR|nr:hypothetical protein DFH08DRAFT_971716 [Mycena albidolilacea]
MAAPGIRRPPHALLAFQLLRDPASPYDCARATLTDPDYQIDSIRLVPTSMSSTTHTVLPASSFYPAILSSPPSHSPSLAVLCSSLPLTDSSRSLLLSRSKGAHQSRCSYVGIARPASADLLTTSFGVQTRRTRMMLRRGGRRCALPAHRSGAHGRFLYYYFILHLPSLPSPLLFPTSRFALLIYLYLSIPARPPSSGPFHSSSQQLAGNPPRKPQIRSINSGGRLSALARAQPCSASPPLRARCTHSAGNTRAPSLPYTPVALPRPRPSSLAPSAHTPLSRPLSLPASCPLLSPTRPHTPHPTRRHALDPSLLSPRFLSTLQYFTGQ